MEVTMRIGNAVSPQQIPSAREVFLQTGATPPDSTSTLEPGKSRSFWGHITNFFSQVCQWIKYHLCCICFDKQAEELSSLYKELDTFRTAYMKKDKGVELSLEAKYAIAKEITWMENKKGSALKTFALKVQFSKNGATLAQHLLCSYGHEFVAHKLDDSTEKSLNKIEKWFADRGYKKQRQKALKILLLEDLLEHKPMYQENGVLVIGTAIDAARKKIRPQLD